MQQSLGPRYSADIKVAIDGDYKHVQCLLADVQATYTMLSFVIATMQELLLYNISILQQLLLGLLAKSWRVFSTFGNVSAVQQLCLACSMLWYKNMYFFFSIFAVVFPGAQMRCGSPALSCDILTRSACPFVKFTCPCQISLLLFIRSIFFYIFTDFFVVGRARVAS